MYAHTDRQTFTQTQTHTASYTDRHTERQDGHKQYCSIITFHREKL